MGLTSRVSAPPSDRTFTERLYVALGSLAAYLLVGWWAVARHNIVMGDAISRLANATYAVASRNPHLSAIGFVWGPLPTLGMIPLRAIGLQAVSPWYIPTIISSMCMAGAVITLDGIFARWGMRPSSRIILTVGFAANPLILFYAINGMSEAPFLLLLLAATDRLARWLEAKRTTDLAGVGLWLAVAYLVRYEALAATAAVCVVVVVASVFDCLKTGWGGDSSPTISRSGDVAGGWRASAVDVAGSASLDMAVVLMPVLTAFGAFAIISWVVTGQALAQFSSTYGNSSVLQSTAHGAGGLAAIRFSALELMGAAPLLVALLIAAILMLRGTLGRRGIAVVTCCGGVLALSLLLQVSAKTLPFLRFWITATLVQVLLGGLLLLRLDGKRRHHRALARSATIALALLGIAFTDAGTALAMASPTYGVQEHQLSSVVDPDRDSAVERSILDQFVTERHFANYLDEMDLPAGSVLVDVLEGFPIVAASHNPAQFVIPSDFDYEAVLSDPAAHGVRYLLTVPAAGRGRLDALNERFAGIYVHGLPGCRLVLQADNDDEESPNWRLYEFNNAPAP